ncbi:MAG: hypothetical protein NTZ10_05425 [Candidatus Saganbacteria bacterium]|nr:hypothetical protein [Candidatus Saganbacteria bacterium]
MRPKYFWILFIYIFLIAVSLSGVFICNFSKVSITILALVSFSSVIAAALLISWGAECYQFVVSQGFAIAIIALLQVIPEFFVEGVIAWEKDVPLMLANFTGSNRLLMGVGWSGIFFIASVMNFVKKKKFLKEIVIREAHSIEVAALLISSFYFCVVLTKGTLTIIDSIVLLSIFAWYMRLLFRLEPEEKERIDDLIEPCKVIVKIQNVFVKKAVILLLFAVGGGTFLFIAQPFLHSLRGLAGVLGISTFLFVQWVAPFLSEFPEKVTAFYWAAHIKLAPMGLVNFISSKVNQWTLLIAMVPVVYSVSCGKIMTVPLDDYHKWQIALSMAMTFYGCSTLAKFRFTFIDACFMFSLWLTQFVFPRTLAPTTFIFLGLTIINICIYRKENRLFKSFVKTLKSLKN